MKQDCLKSKYKADFSCGNICRGTAQGDAEDVVIKRWQLDDMRGQNEISALSQLDCVGVPKLIESFDKNGYRYMVRSWVKGVPLDEFMLANKSIEGVFALGLVQKICALFADLEVKAGKYLHGDIKPQNVIFDEHNQTFSLIDFETFMLFKNFDIGKLSNLKNAGGHTVSFVSEGFTAPEVYNGRIVPQSDIYSIGKLIAFVFGICNINGEMQNEWSAKCNLSKNLISIIKKCTYKSAEKRYRDKTSLLKDVLNIDAIGKLRKELTVANATEEDVSNIISGNFILSASKAAEAKAESAAEYHTVLEPPYTTDARLLVRASDPAADFAAASNYACGGKLIPFIKASQNEEESVKHGKALLEPAKRKIVYIAGNACFASEFSYIASKVLGLKTVLLEADNGIGMGTLNYFIDRQNIYDLSYVSENTEPFGCDAYQMYSNDETKWISRGLLSESKKTENLIMSECNVFSELGIVNENDVLPLIYWTKKHFDITVVSNMVNTGGVMENSMIKYADCVIVPARPNIDEVHTKYNQYKWLCRKNGVPYTKLMFTAWEYEKDKSMKEDDFKLAVEGLYGGLVRYDTERLKCKNVKGDFYCEKFEKTVAMAYKNIISKVLYR